LNEHLTQPGKISVIYFDDRDAEEFKGFIRRLQNENLLLNDLEEFDLEALHCVDGMKATRVGVRNGGVQSATISSNELEKTI
jgi:hypothetical protein